MFTHSRTFGYLLWFFLGIFGVHRFYFGRRLSGILYMCTLGLCGVGYVVDAFLIPGMERDVSRRYQTGTYNYSSAWLLLLALGPFGAHRFYMGRWKTGLLYACTFGLAGIGIVYDLCTLNEMLSVENERWVSTPPRPSLSRASYV
jgi:TM2 domain-containing membrane protein YozV